MTLFKLPVEFQFTKSQVSDRNGNHQASWSQSESQQNDIKKYSSELIPGIHHCNMQHFNKLCPLIMGRETKNSAPGQGAKQGVVPKPALR